MTVALFREDLFVSVCVPDPEGDIAECVRGLGDLAARLGEQFRYWEILLGVPAESSVDYADLAGGIANLRLLKLRAGTSLYRRRVAVAAEAIGDIVVLTSPSEFGLVDPLVLLNLAAETGAVVIGRAGGASVFGQVVNAFGRGAGYRVDSRDLRTVAYPRMLLNVLLAHPDRTLAMRFLPADSAIPVRWVSAAGSKARRGGSIRSFARRLGLLHRLLIASAPRVLGSLAVFSLLVVFAAIAYAIYAAVIWMTQSNVQPGWLTTSIVASMTSAFLGTAVFALAIGIGRVLDLLSTELGEIIVDEVAAVDLYSEAMRRLNVEQSALPEPDAAEPSARLRSALNE